MLYSDLIKQEGEYQYSANIQFDITDDRKLLRYIPNETSIELLKEFFIDTIKPVSTNHSRILYGSYGTGKSHFLTVLSMLLSKSNSGSIAFDAFVSKIKDYDEKLASDIVYFNNDNSQKPFLVVPIVFEFDDFDRCIYFSLKQKLDLIGIKVNFKTFYDQALNLINQWKSSEDSLERLQHIEKELNISLSTLELQLQQFDKKSEKVFNKVFSKMTFGVDYIYEITNLIESLNQVNDAISDRYSGIVFIFDEFGRYIEDHLKKIKVKAVQDLAEYCDHSGNKNYIFLVSHKEISQYTSKANKSLANEWKKVEGRYKATPINDKQDQCLSLIKNIVVKDRESWDLFKNKHQTRLNEIYSEAIEFKGFLVEASYATNPFEGAFPLHPIALYALDKLSKKVAQNERTFFTYLASKEEHSLYSFLSKHDVKDFHFVGLDEIYNYFEANIKSLQSDNSYEWYRRLQAALSKVSSEYDYYDIAIKILKAITVIGIINDPNALTPNRIILTSVIDEDKIKISEALERLSNKKILKFSGVYDRYEFFEASTFDVDELIEKESSSVTEENIISTLNNEFVDFVLYPYAYNHDYKINRVFVPEFATLNTLSKKSFTRKSSTYDGMLVMLLAQEEDLKETIISISNNANRAIIFANRETGALKRLVKKYIGIKYLENHKEKYVKIDPIFEKEVEYYKNEAAIAIHAYIEAWKNNFDESIFIIVDGKVKENINTFKDLSFVASEIMYSHFPMTLIVNNELINKNVTTGSMSSARRNVLKAMLNGSASEDYFGLSFLSPEYIIVRSVLIKNGFISSDIILNQTSTGLMPQLEINNIYDDFVRKAKEKTVSFDLLIDKLKQEPYGLREGYLSILLLYKLLPVLKDVVITSHGNEKEITFELFEEIIHKPADYDISIVLWSDEQKDYINMIELQFEEYINKSTIGKNRLKTLYNAMMSHYKNISKFARTTIEYVSDNTKTYRKTLEKSYSSYSTFFFESLLWTNANNYSDALKLIISAKVELDNAIDNLNSILSEKLIAMFNDNTLSLKQLFITKYEFDWKEKKQKSFDYYTNAVLEFISKLTDETTDAEIINRLAKIYTGFEPIYWSDSHINDFLDKFKESKDKLDAYTVKDKLDDKESKIILVTSSGTEKSIIFDRSEMSALSKTVKNKIKSTFDNYGLAISHSDKTQILLALLEELTEGE